MTLRKGMMAAAVAIMAMSATASAADTKRVLGDAEMDKVTAGVSFAFVINNQVLQIFGIADPVGVGGDPIIESFETTGVPFLFQVYDLGLSFQSQNGTASTRVSSRSSGRS